MCDVHKGNIPRLSWDFMSRRDTHYTHTQVYNPEGSLSRLSVVDVHRANTSLMLCSLHG